MYAGTLGRGGAILATDQPRSTGTERDVELAAAGDTRAFERVYREHAARVHSLARRMIGPEDADDATQEVFVRVWEKLDTFRGDAAFGTWLHRVAVNLILTRARSRKRHGAWIVDDEEAFESASGGSPWTWRRPSPDCPREHERFSSCTTSRDIVTRRSPRCWRWRWARRSRSCTGRGCS
jgi:RNA polymerase sigma factor (sigma-70 family)